MKSYLSLSSIAVACAISLVAVGAQAAFISKSSGATTPTPSDFSAPFAGHPNKVGYNHPNANGMFLETFQAKCPTGQKVGSALFKIKVKKLGAGTSSSDNDALAFWDGGAVAFNTYLWSASDAVGAVKTLNFNMAALPPVGAGVINSPNSGAGGSGMALFNDADFSFSVQDDTSVLEASLEYSCSPDEPARKGLTWGTYPADPVTGSITVSCQGQSASPKPGGACDPYNGDTPGTTVLPVLCFRKLGLPNPVPNAAPTSDPAYWSGGVVATTPAVSPTAKGWTTRSQVDGYCASQFGPGWVVAEHHMGKGLGWKFSAFGNVGNPGTQRFWVDVNNQANGNVWH